jgi:hypothetical protein
VNKGYQPLWIRSDQVQKCHGKLPDGIFGGLGLQPLSGPGHDAVYVSKVVPTSMIFVPCLIVNPLGCLLTGPDYSGEKILTADLDPGEIAEGKFDLDVVGHYARPDVFQLEVNEKACS